MGASAPCRPSATVTTAECPDRGPILHFAKDPTNAGHANIVLIPEYSFFDWLEADMLLWEEEHAMLLATAARTPWASRQPALFFAGNPGSGPGGSRLVSTRLVSWGGGWWVRAAGVCASPPRQAAAWRACQRGQPRGPAQQARRPGPWCPRGTARPPALPQWPLPPSLNLASLGASLLQSAAL